jgi:hypothetical protein
VIGKTVSILGDGGYAGTATVAVGGTASLGAYYNTIAIGLPYTSTITPLELDVVSSQASTAPYFKRLTALYLNVYKTVGGKYGASSTSLHDLQWPRTSTLALLSGGYIMPAFGGPRTECTYMLEQDQPFPFTIRALTPVLEIGAP